ncbi:hypothetical protein CRV01_08985 [Arcobacter sp. CECT 8983]|uniref:hypothetical protein n=1 Tax=Arcobacter sp. CECT 8983 TaxID=2044508 RepID=UPI00100B924C|nr:hypothetical protein [Arcobacter sp. CECT 8983]RXJ88748.1 hypothetical protein CRV01_08985 [Arcobacter sp. CECT 8983]
MDTKKQSNLKSIILQLSIILLIVIGYFAIDFNKLYQSLKGEVKYVTQNKQCDLHQSSCTIKIQDGTEFTLSVEPKTIPLMKPLKFIIKSNNETLKNLTLNIYATNMFMGDFNLPIKNLGNGNYEAIGTLPTCPVGDMQWNADIKIEKATENIGARFQFKTDI